MSDKEHQYLYDGAYTPNQRIDKHYELINDMIVDKQNHTKLYRKSKPLRELVAMSSRNSQKSRSQQISPESQSRREERKKLKKINDYDPITLFSKFQNYYIINKDQKQFSNTKQAFRQKQRIQKAIEASQKIFKTNRMQNMLGSDKRRMEALQEDRLCKQMQPKQEQSIATMLSGGDFEQARNNLEQSAIESQSFRKMEKQQRSRSDFSKQFSEESIQKNKVQFIFVPEINSQVSIFRNTSNF